MANNSGIEWTEATWNPVAGCSMVSPGCTNCYAMRMAARLSIMGQPKYANLTSISGGRHKWNGRINLDFATIELPKTWKKGRRIFVNSMSDLFHEDVHVDFIKAVFRTMLETPQHTYQILTKRSRRLVDVSKELRWPENVWMGVSVETQDFVDRIEDLKACDARVRFLSLEPLLGPIENLDLANIDWVIAGGESGPNARPIEIEWVRSIRDQCRQAEVAFHFKQWGGVNKKRSGRVLDGRTWDEYPSTRKQPSFAFFSPPSLA